MSYYGPTHAWIHVGGRDLTSDTFTLEESSESAFEEVHSFGTTWEEYLPVGIGKLTLAAGGGLYNEGVILDALQQTRETKQLVAWGLSGQTIGRECVIVDGTYAGKWKRVAERNALTKAEAEHTVTGVYRRGEVLHPMGTETADGDTLGASAPKGGVDWADSHLCPKLAIALHNTNDQLFGPVGNPLAITSSNATSNAVICPELFGLKTNDYVIIAGHTGSTPDINGKHQVTVVSAFAFTIGVDITVGGSGGTFSRATGHGLVTGDKVIISDVVGSTPDINGEQTVTRVDDYHFTLDGKDITVAGTGGFFQRVTARQWYAHLHVSAMSGCDGLTVTVLDSPDDDTYSTADTFDEVLLAGMTPTAATATLEYAGGTNATAGRKVTIAGVTYTFVATVAAEYDIDIGADADATMLNLSRAINKSGGTNGAGGDYLVREAHGFVSAVHNSTPNNITLTAKHAGADGNNLTITSIPPFNEPTFTLPSLFTGGVDEIMTAKIETPPAGAVELARYVAISWAFDSPGTESATFFVGLARK